MQQNIQRRLAAVAFADVAGWSRLVETNELDALQSWNTLRGGLIEPLIQEHRGRLVDLAGDAVFVEFASAVDAVNWALVLQRRPVEPGARALWLRIGINVSDVLVDGDRLAGDGVNIASRIHQLASPGEIVVTDAVREHVGKRLAVGWRDLGERTLKNISRAIHVYRVDAPGLQPQPDAVIMAGEPAAGTLLALELPPTAPAPKPGDRDVAALLRRLQQHLSEELLPASGGQLLLHDGPRLLMQFAKPRDAVAAAFAMQRACRSAGAGLGTGREVLPRIGVQLGSASGAAGASLARRLSAIAAPGETLATAAVRDELTPSLDADIEDLGERRLDGTALLLRAYRLGPPGAPQSAEHTDSGSDTLRPTLAVIPFAEYGQGHEPIGEILAEEVIAALSRSADLNVVSRLSTTAFRGRGATLGEVSAHLKAQYVLSGAYRVSQGTLILGAELADARTEHVVWARDLKGSVAGIIEGRDELIDRLVAETSVAVVARELERTRSQSLHSLQTCTLLIGAVALMHRLSLHDFVRAHDMLQLVAKRAPRHAVPLAWLAKWHVLRVWQGWSDHVAADTKAALDFGQRALDNDSHCSLALAVDGFAHTNLLRRLDVAEQRYEEALRVNPNESLALLLRGMLHAFKGEGPQGTTDTQRALRLSPLDLHRYFYDSLAGGAELAAGHYERAIELLERSLRANRMHASTFRMLAVSLWQLGRHEAARAAVVDLMRVEPGLRASQWFAASPSRDYAIGKLFADSLRAAGVPD